MKKIIVVGAGVSGLVTLSVYKNLAMTSPSTKKKVNLGAK